MVHSSQHNPELSRDRVTIAVHAFTSVPGEGCTSAIATDGRFLMHPDEMQLSKHEQKSIVEGVIVLLNHLDPYEAEPGGPDGASGDEYVNVAHPMASLLINAGSITTDQIDAIWQKWFSEPLSVAVGATRAEQFSARLNSLV